jgi:hypothetical protein
VEYIGTNTISIILQCYVYLVRDEVTSKILAQVLHTSLLAIVNVVKEHLPNNGIADSNPSSNIPQRLRSNVVKLAGMFRSNSSKGSKITFRFLSSAMIFGPRLELSERIKTSKLGTF